MYDAPGPRVFMSKRVQTWLVDRKARAQTRPPTPDPMIATLGATISAIVALDDEQDVYQSQQRSTNNDQEAGLKTTPAVP